MTKTIDQRIVDMRFNNKQFERGVKDSVKSLKDLTKGLDLKNAGKGLSELQKAGNSFNLSGIAKGVETISSRFSAFGAVGFTVLQNLTNQAIRLGTQMKDKFMKPMNEGFSEYELKMNSIQTIMTNVRDKGTSLEEVNEVLDDLNGYADKTIYNFAQMTDNLGKFTTAGIGAAEAAVALKGIGNISAGFGVDATKMAGATYQISQALQSPYFMIRDWMSLETAGLSGSLMKDTLKETAAEMGIFVDQSIPFRASLEQGWLTAEVFTKTMEKFANDKNLQAAAQNVTTFTKLIGVMAEVRASGWASTWEAIVGNKDQSTRLWTGISNAFGDVVGAVDAARTAMFKFWNEKGGRRDFLIGIANILIVLADVLEPIEQAFNDTFEAMSGEKLVALSKRFREFTENLKIGEETSKLLGRTFGGLFSLMSIGKKILLTLGKSIFVIINAFTALSSDSNGLLKITATIGDFFKYVDKAVFSSENLGQVLNALGVIIAPIAKVIKNAFMLVGGGLAYLAGKIDAVTIGEYFTDLKTQLLPVFAQLKNDLTWLANQVSLDAIKNELTYIKNKFMELIGGGIDLGEMFNNLGPNIVSAFSKIREFLSPLSAGGSIIIAVFTKVGAILGKVFGAISGFVNGVIDEIKGVGGAISGKAGGLGETMSKIWNAINFENLEKLLKGSLLASIVLVLRKFVTGLSNITSGAGNFMEGIVDTLESIQDTLEAYQKSIKATILIKIAAAIAILTVSLIVLSMVNGKSLAVGLTAMGALLAEVFTAMHLFNKNMDSENAIDLAKMGAGLVGLSAAILLLSASLFIIGKLDLANAGQGLLGIAGLVGILIGVSKYIQTNVIGLAKLSLQFIALAVALTAMIIPIAIIGSLKLETIAKGLSGIGLVLAGLVVFTKQMGKVKRGMASAKVLLVISGSLIAIAYALKIIGELKWVQIGKGLAGLGGALLILAGAMKIIKPTDIVTAQALLIITGAMLVMGYVLRDLGIMEWDTVAKGLMFMIASLGILAGAMKIIKPTDIASATALLIMTGALLLMGTVLRDLGSMDWDVMGKGLAAMAGSLLILVLAANGMTTAVLGAGAMVVIAAALMLLVPSIAALSVLPIEGVGIALLALAGVFTVLGLAAYIIGPLTPVVLVLAASVALLGAGVLLAGVGVGALAVGLVALAGALYANGAALSLVLEDLIPLIPLFVQKLGEGFIEAIRQMNMAIPELGKTLIAIFRALVDVIETSGIIVIEAIIKFVLDILKTIAEYLPQFIETGTLIIMGLLIGLSENIGEITDVVSDIITKFITALTDKQDAFLDAGAKFIITFINNLADTVRENKGLFKDAIINLVSAVIGITKENLTANIAKLKTIGGWLIDGLKSGITSVKDSPVKALTGVAVGMIRAVNKTFDINSPSKVFREIAKNIIDSLSDTIDEEGDKPVKAAGKMTSNVVKENEKVAKSSGKTLKTAFDKAVEWINDRKYYNQLSLQEELEEWQAIQRKYAEGSTERKKADREVYRLKNAIVKAGYEHSVKWIEKEKYYNRLSLKEELAAWERVQQKYEEGSEERIKANREVYRLQKEVVEDGYQHSSDWIDKQKEKKEFTLQEELASWKRVQQKYADLGEEGDKNRIAAEEQVSRVKKEITKSEYEDAIKYIENEKYYNRLSVQEELKLLRQIQTIRNLDSEDRIKTDKDIYRVRKKINEDSVDLYDDIVKASEDARDKRLELEEEYYDKEKELNDKRKRDIKSVSDAYDNALKSRSGSLYGTFGLFEDVETVDPGMLIGRRDRLNKQLTTLADEQKQYVEGSDERKKADEEAVKVKEELVKVNEKLVTGDELLTNLTNQVHAFEQWQLDIRKLAKKGIDDGLIKELEAMGPKSSTQIKALLMLSEKDLEKYVFLWKVKHKTAKDQAVDELDELKTETISKIGEINSQSAIELNEYRKMWIGKMQTLTTETDKELTLLKSKWKSKLEELRTDSEKEMGTLIDNMQKAIKKPNWAEVTGKAMKDMLKGIVDGTTALVSGAKNAATEVANVMTTAFTGNPQPQIEGVGGFMLNALTGDRLRYNQVLTPVLDLSNVRSGNLEMQKLFIDNQTLNSTPNTFGLTSPTDNQGGSNITNEFNIAQLVVREEADVDKVSRDLYNKQVTGSR